MKHLLLIGSLVTILLGCTSPQPSDKSLREHLCDPPDKPKVKQSGEAEMGINSHGEIIRSFSINFETSTLLGSRKDTSSNITPGSC